MVDTGGAQRLCGWCGADISHKRSNALYCSTQHKKNAGARRFRDRNPGYYAQYTNSEARIAWREKNGDTIRAYAREQQARYRREHPDKGREWWAANKEKHRLYQLKRRCREAEGPGVSERDWIRLVRRHEHSCAYCGRRTPDLHMDHIIPLKRGGRHSIGNVLPACQSCNSSKGARLLYPWTVTVRLTQYHQLIA